MIERQRGALNLVWVAIFSALVSVAAMAALWSMRYERNLFAEAVSAVAGGAPARQAIDAARGAVAAVYGGSGAMRKCVIAGKTVISNTECLDSNKTSKDIKIHDTRGIEAPKVPVAPPVAARSDPALDKIIEKQLH
ncbi:MAG: hypothetical protein JWR56_1695 [Massilia sp.]|nr:hypothetical protein [Massilia sp.]